MHPILHKHAPFKTQQYYLFSTPHYYGNLLNFFFQAEYGIRYRDVTGVQTCALPILPDEARVYKTKAKNAQEAHEAVRPTSELNEDRKSVV